MAIYGCEAPFTWTSANRGTLNSIGPLTVDTASSTSCRPCAIDDGAVADQIRDTAPHGVDGAVELVGVNILKDTLRAVRSGGTVCFTGMLSDQWTIAEFYPMDWLPNGVRLTAYSGEAADLTAAVLQDFLDAVASGAATIPVGQVYRLDQIVQAHHDMEAETVGGKGVVLI